MILVTLTSEYFRTLYDLKDVSTYPILIEYLMKEENWTDEEIIKLIGGNILRVLEKNEEVRQVEYIFI